MYRILFVVLCFTYFPCVFSQFTLKSHIGQHQIPEESDPVCIIPNYLGSFEKSGYQIGDTVNDFTLYDLQNKEYTLSKILAENKPVILISGSYTCPIFRDKVSQINEVCEKYKTQINIYIVYTVEAHPVVDISPYFGKVNTGGANETEGILYRQPKLYVDRKNIVAELISNIEIKPTILLDGPCNEWWLHYGPAPNNATIVNSDGTVFSKHDWLNRSPHDLDCDLDKLLNKVADCGAGPTGLFTHQIISDTIIKGHTGEILYGRGVLKNDTKYKVDIKAVRLKKSLPSTWETSMCLDICYGPDVDTAYFYLNPGQQINYYIDFFTDAIPASGSIRIGFANTTDNSNKTAANFFVSTFTSGSRELEIEYQSTYAYPNPFTQSFTIQNNTSLSLIVLKNMEGRTICTFTNPATIDLQTLQSGLYFLHYYNRLGSPFKMEKIIKQ